MATQGLETQLLSLSSTDKPAAIQILTQSLNQNWHGTSKTPGICGGEACIAGTRVPTWVLSSRRLSARLGRSSPSGSAVPG